MSMALALCIVVVVMEMEHASGNIYKHFWWIYGVKFNSLQ